jgi:hypothetical protein
MVCATGKKLIHGMTERAVIDDQPPRAKPSNRFELLCEGSHKNQELGNHAVFAPTGNVRQKIPNGSHNPIV